MAEESGYAVCIPTGTAAYGGCKDWFIKAPGKEGFTVEIGTGQNPLPVSMLDEVYDENAKIAFYVPCMNVHITKNELLKKQLIFRGQ